MKTWKAFSVQRRLTAGLVLLACGTLLIPTSLRAACTPPPAGLIGWWAGESNTVDNAGFQNGVLNGAGYGPGKIGTAFLLNGTNNYVNLGNWSPGAIWTVEAWVNAAWTDNVRRTMAGGVGDSRDWGIVMQYGQYGAVIRPPGGASTLTITSGVPVVNGCLDTCGWHL